MRISNILAGGLMLALMTSCTDVIDIDADFTEAELVVDAWVNQRSATQTIHLSLTQDYFEAAVPPAATGATVEIDNLTQGTKLLFADQGNGSYEWTPNPGGTIGDIGDEFILTVNYNGQTYSATSSLNRVPTVDSIVTEFREPELGDPEGYFAQFYARDFPGIGDTYWIKTFKNGEFLNKPLEMNLSYDGTFDAGSGTDGIVFIPPIREAVNRLSDPDTDDNDDVPPYAIGDSIRVEIHSLTNEAFRFMQIAQEQMTNGDNGIFALPIANVPSNITAEDANAPEALGFFNVSAISSLAIQVEE